MVLRVLELCDTLSGLLAFCFFFSLSVFLPVVPFSFDFVSNFPSAFESDLDLMGFLIAAGLPLMLIFFVFSTYQISGHFAYQYVRNVVKSTESEHRCW